MGVYQRGKAGTGSMGAGMTDESGRGGGSGNGHRVVPLSDRRPFREGEAKKDEAWVQFCENCRP